MIEVFATFGILMPWIFLYLFVIWFLIPGLEWLIECNQDNYWKRLIHSHLVAIGIGIILAIIYYVCEYYMWSVAYFATAS